MNRSRQAIKSLRRLGLRDFYATRNGKIFANLSGAAVFKVINMVISFLMVPITLDYLDKTRYGLWAALSSVLAWFFIFDIGIGHGLRNKFIELKAKEDYAGIKIYISTAYAIFGCIAALVAVVFFIANRFVNWASVLNAPKELRGELSETVLAVFIVLCSSFVLKLINNILAADLKNAMSDGITTLAHLISFVGIIILSRVTEASIMKYALLYTGSNLAVMLMTSIILFSGRYKRIKPSFRQIDLSLWKDMVNVGVKFFFIQIAGVILYHTSSFVLANLVNPEAVTDYNITQKYYSLVTMAFAMLVQPLWSAYGDAYHKHDYKWIVRTIQRLQRAFLLMLGLLVVSLLLQDFVFRVWIKGRVEFDLGLSLSFLLYGSLNLWNSIYNPLLNATSKLKLQIRIGMISVPLFIPLCIFLVKTIDLGPKGIVIALIFNAITGAIVYPIQCRKILRGEGGLWTQ